MRIGRITRHILVSNEKVCGVNRDAILGRFDVGKK
jgi:hypothetical protein